MQKFKLWRRLIRLGERLLGMRGTIAGWFEFRVPVCATGLSEAPSPEIVSGTRAALVQSSMDFLTVVISLICPQTDIFDILYPFPSIWKPWHFMTPLGIVKTVPSAVQLLKDPPGAHQLMLTKDLSSSMQPLVWCSQLSSSGMRMSWWLSFPTGSILFLGHNSCYTTNYS